MPIASGLAVAIVIAAIIFAVTRTSVAGNWYGPGNIEGTNTPVAVAAYMQLSQQLTGSVSGSGQLCVRDAQGVIQTPVTVAGSISGASLKLTVRMNASGAATASVPLASILEMQGTLADGTLTLSGVSPPGVLTLQQGSQSDYATACTNLPTTTVAGAAWG
ncbi:MAG TPA: hypothetical protein VGP82_23555 [Ktedonobacterales bacterium]|nr:hypothetical protein [Ktedonobacterales bacterium]